MTSRERLMRSLRFEPVDRVPHFEQEFVTPYLKRVIAAAKDCIPAVILHSDGNLMPVLDQILEAGPHALQSIDPMAGMDIERAVRPVADGAATSTAPATRSSTACR